MAVLLHCFPSPPSAKPGDSPRPLFGRSLTCEWIPLLSTMEPKMQVLLTSHQLLCEKCKIYPSGGLTVSKRDAQMTIFKEICYPDAILSGFQDLIVSYMSDHQRITSFSFSKALTIVSTLGIILPPEVLAETCEADNSIFNMPLLFAIAMIGATVGGLLARQRRGELKRLNDQLRQINAALRRQAKIESYAPNLSYAPVGSRLEESEVVVDPRKEHLITRLRTGKNYLRNQNLEKAFAEFKAALELAQALGDHVEAKKAARGLGASLQRQGKYREAIKYHSMVLDISKKAGEDSGITEAYGAIADCYTELGELERAGKFYDEYIARLEND
ncbi:protein FLUORESCENT IN BLUE LIGHT [Musa troglodytarum]|uniref:Protein FLUORESCENT IN BLUE LIGHT n=1 Tax=Musa troglodytarum TaxID=320322 RepID=A0A9E7HBC1_9LILI|nr:protein FLUORESCENT IN BLUE LIGHT [Musa troglodytarum]